MTGDTIEFDLSGQICPSTLLIALREINRHAADLKNGQLALLFKTNYSDSIQTITESAQNMGYLVEVSGSAGDHHIRIVGRRENQ